ncbi:flagellar protein [Sporosarcina sp. P21c]|uniref:TIGR02530 family flagellar biosynthesis protein n=1 Tax=Sporosarcina TaxID=1569 RepID=UPI000A16A9F4|nr:MULTISPECIES: TIGR02530 family flagellar biosynthesis protein [Sporosarcina]ARJ40037.1 flagellar protein [Sporosarcina ureae]PIC68767.1 flagellar protein [Sporosarcina sp. P16a]PIC84463.1 flagellar protein [Sporosarcina sp. P1]PIC91051.1 flagellar protein [Sporosarcina sp. P21c]PIC93819.1 flagellar protein [Sporosarcina sp. P25]
MNKIDIHRIPSPPPIRQGQIQAQSKQSFLEHLQQATRPEKLKISKHANDRLQERGIQMTDAEWAHISEKVDEAKRKGIRESLVLTDQVALIVSAKNSTVITAMNRMEAKDQLFTNIDGTILLS